MKRNGHLARLRALEKSHPPPPPWDEERAERSFYRRMLPWATTAELRELIAVAEAAKPEEWTPAERAVFDRVMTAAARREAAQERPEWP